jgi:hypothetical protein
MECCIISTNYYYYHIVYQEWPASAFAHKEATIGKGHVLLMRSKINFHFPNTIFLFLYANIKTY